MARNPGGPPPPHFEGAVAAQAHDAVSTRLHYTGWKEEHSLLWPLAVGKEPSYSGGPGEEPQSPAINPRLDGSSISSWGRRRPHRAIYRPAVGGQTDQGLRAGPQKDPLVQGVYQLGHVPPLPPGPSVHSAAEQARPQHSPRHASPAAEPMAGHGRHDQRGSSRARGMRAMEDSALTPLPSQIRAMWL